MLPRSFIIDACDMLTGISEDAVQAFGDLVDFFARRSRPRLKRIAPIPISGMRPIASSTGERSMRPEWHAAPAEVATPSSSFNISAPIQLMKDTLRVFESG